MAVSGTTAFNVTRDQIIQYALRKCGVLGLGVTPDATTVTNISLALDMLVKSWITKGIKLWTLTELTLPFSANKTTYTIGPAGSVPNPIDLTTDKPLKLIQAWIRNVGSTTQNDIPLQILSQTDYNTLGSKPSTGTPNSVYMSVGREQATVKLYVTPDSFSSTNYQLHLVSQRLLNDVGSASNTMDFPQEWLYALGWNLAREIMIDYSVPKEKRDEIRAEADRFLTEVESWDQEYNSIYFTPDMRTIRR